MVFDCFRVAAAGEGVGKLQQMELDELSDGDTVIRVNYSSINYKDALAATGKGKILRQFPLNVGIDLCGEVVESPHFKQGQRVFATGGGVGEVLDGGMSRYARLPAEKVLASPSLMTDLDLMTLGTAGFTVGLCLWRLEQLNIKPEQGPVLVTGATGGVGSIAVQCLSKLGYAVIALTGKLEQSEWLKRLGATEVVDATRLALGERPLENARFAAAIDSVGGSLLAQVLAHIQPYGAAISVGLAGGHAFQSTVMPFILRGVSLLGVTAANTPKALRDDVWQKMAGVWKPDNIEAIRRDIVPLGEVAPRFDELLNRTNSGRIVVDCR
tara:strand:- start:1558 stop:2535 length:978 start_codon:yes stop_codon:yes gene_type:complete